MLVFDHKINNAPRERGQYASPDTAFFTKFIRLLAVIYDGQNLAIYKYYIDIRISICIKSLLHMLDKIIVV